MERVAPITPLCAGTSVVELRLNLIDAQRTATRQQVSNTIAEKLQHLSNLELHFAHEQASCLSFVPLAHTGNLTSLRMHGTLRRNGYNSYASCINSAIGSSAEGSRLCPAYLLRRTHCASQNSATFFNRERGGFCFVRQPSHAHQAARSMRDTPCGHPAAPACTRTPLTSHCASTTRSSPVESSATLHASSRAANVHAAVRALSLSLSLSLDGRGMPVRRCAAHAALTLPVYIRLHRAAIALLPRRRNAPRHAHVVGGCIHRLHSFGRSAACAHAARALHSLTIATATCDEKVNEDTLRLYRPPSRRIIPALQTFRYNQRHCRD